MYAEVFVTVIEAMRLDLFPVFNCVIYIFVTCFMERKTALNRHVVFNRLFV